ncbi:hypothetical protein D9M73_44680 [compost metagenome]
MLLAGTASPIDEMLIVTVLVCGLGQAGAETLTVAVTVTRLVADAMGNTALLAEQVNVVLLPLGVQVHMAGALLARAVTAMPAGRVSVTAGEVMMAVADWLVAWVVA